MGLHLLYGAALFGASVNALAFPGPQPTDPFQALPQNGWSPRPTPAPEAHVVLRRQQNILPSTYLLAPDNTCGFINGNAKSAYACVGDDMKCAFIPSSSKVAGAAGCCKGNDCAFRVSCVGDADIDDDCDSKCQADALTLKCTGSAKFCATVSFPGGVTDYYCGTKRVIGVLRAQTTNADDKTRSMSTVKVTSTTTKASSTSTSKTSSTSSSSQSSSSTSSVASSSTSAAPKTTSSATNTAVAGAATSSAPPVATTAAPTPVGAIVGGVIGGIALVALIVLGAIFLRQHKKKHAVSELPPPQPFMSQPSFSTTQPPRPSYAQTTASSRMSYEPMPNTVSSATATPAQMYAVPAAAAVGAAGSAAAAAGAFNSYHNNSNNNRQQHHPGSIHSNSYPDPSPLTTPGHSPNPQYQHQPHAPPPLPQPSYYNHANHSPQPSQDHGPWTGAGAGAVEPPDRQFNSTPVSTYNGTTPVTPASALGSMPGEQPQQQGAMGGVPLILQPGMGYRPYRPRNASVGTPSRAGSGSGSGSGNMSGNGSGSDVAGVRAVAGSPGPEGPRQAQAVVVPQQAQPVAVHHNHPHPDESRGQAVELP